MKCNVYVYIDKCFNFHLGFFLFRPPMLIFSDARESEDHYVILFPPLPLIDVKLWMSAPPGFPTSPKRRIEVKNLLNESAAATRISLVSSTGNEFD